MQPIAGLRCNPIWVGREPPSLWIPQGPVGSIDEATVFWGGGGGFCSEAEVGEVAGGTGSGCEVAGAGGEAESCEDDGAEHVAGVGSPGEGDGGWQCQARHQRRTDDRVHGQLIQRYLIPTGLRYGIYLICWIDPAQRPAGKHKGPADRDKLAEQLTAQAAAADSGRQVRPRILDISHS